MTSGRVVADTARTVAANDKLEALHQRLADQVAALTSGKDWKDWLGLAARFHSYSFRNTLLILSQNPEATQVAGYSTWKALGRQVGKGEKGIQILAPVTRRRETGNPPELQEKSGDIANPTESAEPPAAERGRRLVGWRVAHVWDVSQTTGEPLPAAPAPELLRGQAPEGLWDQLAAQLASAGYALDRGDCGQVNGYTDFTAHTVRIRADVDDAQATKTLIHELAHVLMHAPADGISEIQCRGTAEVEAESVAYLVAAAHHLPTDGYTFPYVAGWAAGVAGSTPDEVVVATGQRVLRVAHRILDRTPTATGTPAESLVVADVARRDGMRFGPPQPLRESSEPDTARDELVSIHEQAASFFQEHASRSWVPDYLSGRGLLEALASSSPWQVGYAPDSWTTLTEHLRRAGHGDAAIRASGLALLTRNGRLIDRFRARLMLPVRDADGRVIAFVGRAHSTDEKEVPRYLHSPDTLLYRKGEHLFGLGEAAGGLRSGAVPVLVNGPLDAVAVTTGTRGRHVGLAPCGTALTPDHVQKLVAVAGEGSLVVATDADQAGRAAARRAYELLGPHARNVRVADIPPGMDPATLLQQRGSPALERALGAGSRPLIDAAAQHSFTRWLDRFQEVDRRAAAIHRTAPNVGTLCPRQAMKQIDPAGR